MRDCLSIQDNLSGENVVQAGEETPKDLLAEIIELRKFIAGNKPSLEVGKRFGGCLVAVVHGHESEGESLQAS